MTDADACCDPFAFCKPIPKKPTDRDALLKAVVSGNPKFFLYVPPSPPPFLTLLFSFPLAKGRQSNIGLSTMHSLTDSNSGSDSAPHQISSKTSAEQGKAPAGVFTQPAVTQLVLMALEEGIERGDVCESDVTQEKLEGFLSQNGRRFYKLPDTSSKRIVLERKGDKIGTSVKSADGKMEVGISRAGTEVFSLTWNTL